MTMTNELDNAEPLEAYSGLEHEAALDDARAEGPPAATSQSRPSPPVSPGRQVARLALVCVAVICTALLLDAFFVSAMQHRATQSRLFAKFRAELARGEAPVGQSSPLGGLLDVGTPVALLDIPSAHIHEVVVEGTTPDALTAGPGHSRSTPFPGQPGTSVILGRRGTFGGPFKHLASLKPGAVIHVTTGQGQSDYRVIGVRRPGDPLPPAVQPGKGRLVLVTAAGSPLAPSGVLYVDADLTSASFPSPPRAQAAVGPSERPLGTDRNAALFLVLWLQVMIAIVAAATWSWYRWGRFQTWIVFVPLVLFAGIETAGQFLRLLPNLT
jgi:LPXTG-site transpeptidase (sortase) family protein